MGDGNIITRQPTITPSGRADVIQHAHDNNVYFNFKSPNLAAGTVNYILVDFSDKTNYKHNGSDYIHLENFNIKIDSDNNGAYTVCIGFLENVDATNGDFYELACISGSKQAGNNIAFPNEIYPNGPKCKSDFIVTSTILLNDTAYQTDVNLATIRSPGAANTPSGNQDLILKSVVTAGNIIITANGSYHGH
jgi:hypothetical protein